MAKTNPNTRLFLERNPDNGEIWIRKGIGPGLKYDTDVFGPYADVDSAKRGRNDMAALRRMMIQLTAVDREA